jgi:hypothetical protein
MMGFPQGGIIVPRGVNVGHIIQVLWRAFEGQKLYLIIRGNI